MGAECERAGLAVPILEEIGTQFRVTCRLSEGMDPGFLKIMAPPGSVANDMLTVLQSS
jgi:hypothetical protein